MEKSEEDLIEQSRLLNDNDDHQETLNLLKDDLLERYKNDELYLEKAIAYIKIGLHKRALPYVDKVLSNNPNNARANNCYGIILNRQGKRDLAIESFLKAIKIDVEYVAAYNNIGLAYNSLKDYEKAIEYFQKVISLNSNYIAAYNSTAIAYSKLGNEEKAVEYYTTSISINPDYSPPYYNRANVYFQEKKYNESLKDYEKYIELKKGTNDVYIKISKSKILEIKKIIKSAEYGAINELVNKIKDLLQFRDGCITHYTSLTVARALILNNSLLRLSEGSFLNDTSEGRELFNYLSFHHSIQKRVGTLAERFSQKPFIGSFVAEIKHDDLTLWRMYGKEEKEEAKGCALTIDMNKLLDDLNSKINSTNEGDNSNDKTIENFCFYRVAYRKQVKDIEFIIPNAKKEDQENLNLYMKELSEKIALFKKKRGKKAEEDIKSLLELLNEIAYLFKSDEYRFENEVRMVISGISFNKTIKEEDQKPKVYIELVSIRPLLRKITLGPKVERADEWAAAFHYNLDKDNYVPEILISHLPFK